MSFSPFKKRTIVAAVIAVAGTAVFASGPASPQTEAPIRTDVSAGVLPRRTSIPHLDSTLIRFLEIRQTRGEAIATAYAEKRVLQIRNGAVRVVVEGRINGGDARIIYSGSAD